MEKALLITIMTVTCLHRLDAAVILNADSSNIATTTVDNSVNSGSANGVSGNTASGSLVFTQTGGTNNAAGFTSTSDINTLLNNASLPQLAATDTVIFTLAVDSITGSSLVFNQVRFGMVGSTAGLTPGPSELVVLRNNIATAASLRDGFTATLTANSAGYTFSFRSVTAVGGGPLADITGTFSGTEFLDNFGSGHFHFSTQKAQGADTISTIGVASIEVVPEPSALALLTLSTMSLLARRSR